MGHALMIMQVVGALAAGQAQDDASEVNAANVSRQGKMEQAIATRRAEKRKREGDKLLALNKARAAKEGVDMSFGSALDFFSETEADLEFEQLMEAQSGVRAKAQSDYQAALIRQRGNQAKTASFFKAATIIGGNSGGSMSFNRASDPWAGMRRVGFG